MRPLDKIGPMASVVTAVIAIGRFITLARQAFRPGSSSPRRSVCTLCSATHSSLNGTVGLFYPTNIRSNGVGWASGLWPYRVNDRAGHRRLFLVVEIAVAGVLISSPRPIGC